MTQRKSGSQQIKELAMLTFMGFADGDLPEQVKHDAARDVMKLVGTDAETEATCGTCGGRLARVTTKDGQEVEFCPGCNTKGR